MRVAYVSVSDRMGGSEAVLLELMRGLRRDRAEWGLHLITPGAGELLQAARAAGVAGTVVAMPDSIARFGETAAGAAALPIRLLQAALAVPSYQRRFDAAMRAISPDIVHTNGFKAHVFAARHRIGGALVWHLHEYIGARPVTRALLRRYARYCDALVTNSESVAADVRGTLASPPLSTILNGVDLEMFSPDGPVADLDALSALPPAAPGTVRVGLPATFARWKGHTTFIQALAMLSPQVPVRGYVIGGPLYDTRGSQHTVAALRTLARDLGIADRIGFTGFVATPAHALRALDVVVHASTEPEPFGMVIAEAMACGRAVITTAAGGAGELVRDGHDAIVHPRGDAKALARCIESLATDAGLRSRLAANARASAVERFDARRMTEQFVRLYEQTAARRRTA